MCGIGLSRIRMGWTFPQDLSRATPRFSRSPVARNHPPVLFPSNWVNYDYDPRSDRKKHFFQIQFPIVIAVYPDGSKKCWRWFRAIGPLEKRVAALERSWRKVQPILRREKTNFAPLRGTSSCEHAESDVFNWPQIRLHNNMALRRSTSVPKNDPVKASTRRTDRWDR